MTDVAVDERNIVSEETFVAARIFDYRRCGTLVYRYRKSKLWTIPTIRKIDPISTPFQLAMQLAKNIPVQGSQRVTTARTLFECSKDVAVKNTENDFIRWQMFVYGIEFEGHALAMLEPGIIENADQIRFVPGPDIITLFNTEGINEITYRFVKAMEKQECLR